MIRKNLAMSMLALGAAALGIASCSKGGVSFGVGPSDSDEDPPPGLDTAPGAPDAPPSDPNAPPSAGDQIPPPDPNLPPGGSVCPDFCRILADAQCLTVADCLPACEAEPLLRVCGKEYVDFFRCYVDAGEFSCEDPLDDDGPGQDGPGQDGPEPDDGPGPGIQLCLPSLEALAGCLDRNDIDIDEPPDDGMGGAGGI